MRNSEIILCRRLLNKTLLDADTFVMNYDLIDKEDYVLNVII